MKTPPPVAPPGEAFVLLKRAVIERTGHHYYDDKDDLLWDRVRKRMSAMRVSEVADYLERLSERDHGEAEWTALEAELTIGETYFFRYPEQFQALRETILPALLEQRRDDRRLRIWSAGCATGAEAYSVAILLHEMLGDRAQDWRVSILGTDINEAFLAVASRAKFGRWALRTLNPEQLAAWFEKEEGGWRLRAPFRNLVRFQRSNLLDLLGPSPPLELADFDLILCRNVLIYFHPAKVTEVAGALAARLRPDGWMLVGHAEPNPDFARIATPVSLPGTVAYRPLSSKSDGAALDQPVADANTQTSASTWAPMISPAEPIANRRPAAPRFDAAPTAVPSVDPVADTTAIIQEVRRRADVGDFEAALNSCREGLRRQPDEPTLYFYLGLVEQARGRMGAAEEALRRAVYLDPTFILAQFHLGLVRVALGRTHAGRKAIASAARLAGTLTLTECLPEGEGLTAGELRELARVKLEAEGDASND